MTTMEPTHRSTSSGGSHHPSLPASPTLTNPDMILPDYDRAPSPVGLDDPNGRSQSPLTMWKNAQVAGASLNMNMGMRDAQSQQQFRGFSSVVPTTPIIYGNGTMLSDIGEVTEVESTLGHPSPPTARQSMVRIPSVGSNDEDTETDAALRSSLNTGKSGGISSIKTKAKEQRERRSSTGSDSTITDHENQANLFADFSDAVSVGDSVFQGDDEESLASSYVDDQPVAALGPITLKMASLATIASRQNGQKYSTAQLSRRAEQILANAKKRLTTMEDNLTRARTSLAVTTYSSASDGSTPSPPIIRAQSVLLAPPADLSSSSSLSGHSRRGSDLSLRIGLPIKVYSQRSSSVLGVPSNPRQQPLTVSKSAEQLNGQYNRHRTSYIMREVSAESLSEDNASQHPIRGHLGTDYRHSSLVNPTFGGSHERGLSRSASVSQMRDIKDQVNDLKGKIANLRNQTRVDSLKRRSLQTLRTPSPFTHAQINQWYPGSGPDPESKAGPSNTETSPWDGEISISEDSPTNGHLDDPGDSESEDPLRYSVDRADFRDDLEDGHVDQLKHHSSDAIPEEAKDEIELGDDNDDLLTENGDVEDENLADEGFVDAYDVDMESESGDSVYQDSVQHHLSHEDREDAFDYEHFFLHSAMGTMSQRLARRASDASYSSDDSVETARGPLGSAAEVDEKRPQGLNRRGSETSISTIETFATAEENPLSRQGSTSSGSGGKGEAEVGEDLPVQYATAPSDTSSSPPTAKRATFAGIDSAPYVAADRTSFERQEMYLALRRPISTTAATRRHRPSVSSFDSTGTTRSFPLVKSRDSKAASTGILTPEGGSPDQAVKAMTNSLMNGTAGVCDEMQNGRHATNDGRRSAASMIQDPAVLETLHRDDQFLVERLVASLGRCVLGLTEISRASSEGRMYRRRLDAARRILEGIDSV